VTEMEVMTPGIERWLEPEDIVLGTCTVCTVGAKVVYSSMLLKYASLMLPLLSDTEITL